MPTELLADLLRAPKKNREAIMLLLHRICHGVSGKVGQKHRLDYATRQDYTSDAFVDCVEKIGNYKEGGNAHAFFSTVAFRSMIHSYREKKRFPKVGVELDE